MSLMMRKMSVEAPPMAALRERYVDNIHVTVQFTYRERRNASERERKEEEGRTGQIWALAVNSNVTPLMTKNKLFRLANWAALSLSKPTLLSRTAPVAEVYAANASVDSNRVHQYLYYMTRNRRDSKEGSGYKKEAHQWQSK